jgi:periplasmic divalent cation tolerance protein
MTDFIQISTTAGKREEAERISREMLERRLAACAQIIGPIKSLYWWKGNIEETQEWLILIKTRKELYSQAEQAIASLHSYETPEILAVPIVEGSRNYSDWLMMETNS